MKIGWIYQRNLVSLAGNLRATLAGRVPETGLDPSKAF